MIAMNGFAEQLLTCTEAAVRLLAETGRDYKGLFPSILDRKTGKMPWTIPGVVTGQRWSDRSYPGSNLMHDHVTLRLMRQLTQVGRGDDLQVAADAYIHRFATHCCVAESGLFPWGEHAFWNLAEDRIGNSYALDRTANGLKHDHLWQAPVWLWEELWKVNRQAVVAFAEGLDNHWRLGDRLEYNRHAPLDRRGRISNPDPCSCDFPRHSGFYALDLAFVYAKAGESRFESALRTVIDYWWDKRQEDGLLTLASRMPDSDRFYSNMALVQTLSLGVSLLEVAGLLREANSELEAQCRLRGLVYVQAFLQAPHRPEKGEVIGVWNRRDRAEPSFLKVWGSVYGDSNAALAGVLLLRAAELIPIEGALEFAEKLGHFYLTTPVPSGSIPVRDAGLVLGFLTELWVRTGSEFFREGACAMAEQLMSLFFTGGVLPRAATDVEWYESQTMPGQLLYAMGRLGAILSDRRIMDTWGADSTLR